MRREIGGRRHADEAPCRGTGTGGGVCGKTASIGPGEASGERGVKGRAGARVASAGGVAGAADRGVRTGRVPAEAACGASALPAWGTASWGLSLMVSWRPRWSGGQHRAVGARGRTRRTSVSRRRSLVKGAEQANQGAVLIATGSFMMLGRRTSATVRRQVQNLLLQPPSLQQGKIVGRQCRRLGGIARPCDERPSSEVNLAFRDGRADGGYALRP